MGPPSENPKGHKESRENEEKKRLRKERKRTTQKGLRSAQREGRKWTHTPTLAGKSENTADKERLVTFGT